MINEETLTLYYYEDGLSKHERRQVEQALQEDAVLAARFADLKQQLEQWREAEETVVPSHLLQRWHDSIDRAAQAERQAASPARPAPVHFMSFFWGSAVTAALAIGIGIGFWFSAPEADQFNPENAIADLPPLHEQVVPASFTRGLQLHLQESQWEIVSLPVDDDSQRALLALQLIEQNRFFVRAATMNSSPELARVLRAFEPVLMRLASEDLSPEDAIALQEKLAFEISVMLTKISRDTSEVTQTI